MNAPIEDVAAFQYTAINQAILDAKASVPAGQWVEVFYEDFLRDPVATFRQVFEGCGLGIRRPPAGALRRGARHPLQRLFRNPPGQMEGRPQSGQDRTRAAAGGGRGRRMGY